MIVITVELWPKGKKAKAKEIARMRITNDGTSKDSKIGNYKIKVMRGGTKSTVQREAEVKNYPRNAYSVWKLVKRAIQAAY
jgi:hypothetical protein